VERFDGAAHWAKLSREAKDEIGAIALELVVAWHCQNRAYEDFPQEVPGGAALLRAADAADQLLIDLLRSAFVDNIEEAELASEDGKPRIPALLGPICRSCGCSQCDACQPLSCSWVEPDLCSACVEPAGEVA
jgi:hypothetical protein